MKFAFDLADLTIADWLEWVEIVQESAAEDPIQELFDSSQVAVPIDPKRIESFSRLLRFVERFARDFTLAEVGFGDMAEMFNSFAKAMIAKTGEH